MTRRTILVVIVVLLAGCNSPPPEHGTVLHRDFSPAYTHTTLIPIYCGKTMMLMPQIIHFPDSWSLTVRADCGVKYTFSVSKATFDAHPPGSDWIAPLAGRNTS